MPSDSYATAFMMTMCYEQHPGAAPWDDPAILLALQISHPNAGKKQLGLPESKSRAVHAFISAVRNRMLAVRSDYIKEGDCDDGRISYVKWFRKVSLVLNTIVEHELMEADIHPTQVIAKIGKDEFPCLEYWQAWSHTLGEIVFGTSVMNLAGFVDSDAVSSVARIISYNLLRLRRQWKSARGRIGKHRQLALECMEVLNSAGPDFCLADLQAAMAAVKIWQAASLWFPQEGKLIEGHIITIEALFGTIGHSSGREEEQMEIHEQPTLPILDLKSVDFVYKRVIGLGLQPYNHHSTSKSVPMGNPYLYPWETPYRITCAYQLVPVHLGLPMGTVPSQHQYQWWSAKWTGTDTGAVMVMHQYQWWSTRWTGTDTGTMVMVMVPLLVPIQCPSTWWTTTDTGAVMVMVPVSVVVHQHQYQWWSTWWTGTEWVPVVVVWHWQHSLNPILGLQWVDRDPGSLYNNT
ncbi:hypothetical protein BD779DRAFT_1473576 [Infundibulicybe gibba]|nr:hypothetical protein BD779DRAFT_1473576 [Infundibulicybe gibba]